MASTYEPIASVTLSTTAADITFSNIPGTYTDLVAQAFARSARSDSTNDLRFYVNGVNTGTSYSFTRLFGDGSNPYSDRGSNKATVDSIGGTAGATATAGNYSHHTVHFMSYANTNVFKTILASGSYAPGGGNGLAVLREVAMYRSTNAITSISFVMLGGFNIASGTTIALYGIKAA